MIGWRQPGRAGALRRGARGAGVQDLEFGGAVLVGDDGDGQGGIVGQVDGEGAQREGGELRDVGALTCSGGALLSVVLLMTVVMRFSPSRWGRAGSGAGRAAVAAGRPVAARPAAPAGPGVSATMRGEARNVSC